MLTSSRLDSLQRLRLAARRQQRHAALLGVVTDPASCLSIVDVTRPGTNYKRTVELRGGGDRRIGHLAYCSPGGCVSCVKLSMVTY